MAAQWHTTARIATGAASRDWWKDAVIYQIYPRSFRDANGDGIGDLAGIREKLPYVARLGVDAIWISPFVRSPMRDFGYDVSDFTAVDPMFGTLADFDALVADAHALGLRVVMDQVWNHTSIDHAWFRESRRDRENPRADWYVWADPAADGGPPNNWRSTFGGSAWTFDEERRQYYLHNFLASQPDLDWYNADVRAALIETGRFWLDRGVDGFRLDVVNFFTHDRTLRDNPRRPASTPRPDGAAPNDPFFDFVNVGTVDRAETLDFLGEVRALMDAYPGTFTLGEISSAEDSLATAAEFVRGERRLDSVYNASLISHEPFTASHLRALLARVDRLFVDRRICWTFGTHDFPRLKGRWHRHRTHDDRVERNLDRMLLALLVTLPGSCCIYQGDELGLTQAQLAPEELRDPFGIAAYPENLGRDGCRTPMPWTAEAPGAGFTASASPWLPVPAQHLELAVERQEHDDASLLAAYRDFLRWRKRLHDLRDARVALVDGDASILAFERRGDARTLLAVFNVSADDARFRADDGWRIERSIGCSFESSTLALEGYAFALLVREAD